MAASILLGVLAVYLLPREEEPQISVPMIDVFVQMPGASAAEVEQRVTKPVEKLIWELPGVEYIYSTASPGQSLTVVRFLVGWNEERAIVEVNQKLSANFDIIPQGTSPPLVKPRRIDDVPILALTLHGDRYDAFALRGIAAAVNDAVKQVKDVSETTLIGGLRRQVRVELDAARSDRLRRGCRPTWRNVSRTANRQSRTGSIPSHDGEILVETGGFLHTAAEVGAVVVGVQQGQLVYLRDVAQILDGPEESVDYVLFGHGASAEAAASAETGVTAALSANGDVRPAVTLAVAKRPGTNAIDVGTQVLQKVELLKGSVIPAGVEVTVTRDYGRTATEKSNELLLHMGIAVVGVSLLVALVLGWREAFVVAIAIPVTLALTLATFYFLGFTLNRVTLFALIFSIGILVDDPIVDVENIVRHFRLPQNKGGAADRGDDRGRERGPQPPDPGDPDGHRGGAAHGLRAGADGALHAAHPHRRHGGHALLHGRGLHRDALGGQPAARQARPARPERPVPARLPADGTPPILVAEPRTGAPACTGGSWGP